MSMLYDQGRNVSQAVSGFCIPDRVRLLHVLLSLYHSQRYARNRDQVTLAVLEMLERCMKDQDVSCGGRGWALVQVTGVVWGPGSYLRTPFNVLDLVIVVASWLALGLPELVVLRVVRAARPVRLFSRQRHLKVPELGPAHEAS